jgi:hypothetical protein
MRVAGVLTAILLWNGAAEAQGTGAIAGVVRDTSGRYIVGAELIVDGFGRKAVTDDSGRFHLDGIPAGKNGFLFRKLGLSPVSFETSVAAEKTLVLAINMQPAEQTLDAVVVKAAMEPAGLTRAGFYERQKQGLGYFLTPAKVDSLQHLGSPSQLLRDVPGVEVDCRGTTRCALRTRSPPFCMHLFVDGRYERGTTPQLAMDENLSTSAIAAIEVYRTPVSVPHEFSAPLAEKAPGARTLTQKSGCGAVVVWTKAKA